jgi:antitoxin component YwqK of YwqJK toxin-antitoxin module
LQRQALKAADTSNKSSTPDTVQVTLTATPQEIRAYDSLLFELQKSQVQVDMLKRKLEEEDDGNYLTFTNRKGNTAHYVGEVKNGKAHGQGIAILNTGSRYVGEWKNNMRHGQGAFFWPDGEFYQGSYKDDIRHGQGTYFWPSGEKFSGQWANDQRNGMGIFYGEDGSIVARGVWKNDELVEVDKEKP